MSFFVSFNEKYFFIFFISFDEKFCLSFCVSFFFFFLIEIWWEYFFCNFIVIYKELIFLMYFFVIEVWWKVLVKVIYCCLIWVKVFCYWELSFCFVFLLLSFRESFFCFVLMGGFVWVFVWLRFCWKYLIYFWFLFLSEVNFYFCDLFIF